MLKMCYNDIYQLNGALF